MDRRRPCGTGQWRRSSSPAAAGLPVARPHRQRCRHLRIAAPLETSRPSPANQAARISLPSLEAAASCNGGCQASKLLQKWCRRPHHVMGERAGCASRAFALQKEPAVLKLSHVHGDVSRSRLHHVKNMVRIHFCGCLRLTVSAATCTCTSSPHPPPCRRCRVTGTLRRKSGGGGITCRLPDMVYAPLR